MLYRKRNEAFFFKGGEGGWKFKIRVSLFGGFQKAQLHHEVEQFHP